MSEIDINKWLKGLRILVTGVTGTVGQELVCQLANLDVAEIRGLDNNGACPYLRRISVTAPFSVFHAVA